MRKPWSTFLIRLINNKVRAIWEKVNLILNMGKHLVQKSDD